MKLGRVARPGNIFWKAFWLPCFPARHCFGVVMARLVWRGNLFLAWHKAFGQEEGPILSSVTLRRRKGCRGTSNPCNDLAAGVARRSKDGSSTARPQLWKRFWSPLESSLCFACKKLGFLGMGHLAAVVFVAVSTVEDKAWRQPGLSFTWRRSPIYTP